MATPDINTKKPRFKQKRASPPTLQALIKVIKKLRSPQGCPWDKEQTITSLTSHVIEEAYELADAMATENYPALQEELGDVLLHVVMLATMAEEQEKFRLSQVIQDITQKMILRHPHVFGNTRVSSVQEVWQNWDKIKQKEKNQSTLASIPKHLPALMQAHLIQKRAARCGFDWPDLNGPLEKIAEEIKETIEEYEKPAVDRKQLTLEFGDILFSLVNLARKMGIDPEEALRLSNKKFSTRFQKMEFMAQKNKTELSGLTSSELELLWQKVKNESA